MLPAEQAPDLSGYDALKRRLIDKLRENIVLSRAMSRRLKWDVMQVIAAGKA
jgi:hypothetical protein